MRDWRALSQRALPRLNGIAARMLAAPAIVVPLVFSSAALAAARPEQAGETSGPWWVPLAAALIGGFFGSLAEPTIKEIWIQRIVEKRTKTEQQHEVFRNYAAPLAAAAEKLTWRCAEIFIDKRHHWLSSAALPQVYSEYKRTSTLYRIACILGWIRAMHLELSALPRGASGFATPVSDAVDRVQKALADGPHVELLRLNGVCHLWGIDLAARAPDLQEAALAAEFEVKFYETAGDQIRTNRNYLRQLDHQHKVRICRQLAEFLCTKLKRQPLDEGVITGNVDRAMVELSYREAWIYRDWQDAIGDAMLALDPDSVRRYKIIGFKGFEEIMNGRFRWIEAFRDNIVDIDFDVSDPYDARANQLKSLAAGVADIVLSIARQEKDLVIDPQSIGVAKQLAKIGA